MKNNEHLNDSLWEIIKAVITTSIKWCTTETELSHWEPILRECTEHLKADEMDELTCAYNIKLQSLNKEVDYDKKTV